MSMTRMAASHDSSLFKSFAQRLGAVYRHSYWSRIGSWHDSFLLPHVHLGDYSNGACATPADRDCFKRDKFAILRTNAWVWTPSVPRDLRRRSRSERERLREVG
jgi:hypothetical protein